jgi:diketogulonate reductase-like aldo/keto reductase
MNHINETIALHNGYQIPIIGLGTWKSPEDRTTVDAICAAVNAGYRHVDTAAYYQNEVSVGEGIRACGIDRSKLFVTSKVWNSDRGYEKTMAAFEQTMAKLKLDYLDLYLIHWPAAKHQFDNWEEINLSTWKALTELYKSGRIKAIGVSNFLPHHLEALMQTEIPPMVNQIEFHPGYMQSEVLEYCHKHNIAVEAWSPMGAGRLLTHETLVDIAAKYNKTTAQLCIRWCLQHGTIPLPKSINPDRILDNTKVFDFEISAEDMALIDAMPYCGKGISHPDSVNF